MMYRQVHVEIAVLPPSGINNTYNFGTPLKYLIPFRIFETSSTFWNRSKDFSPLPKFFQNPPNFLHLGGAVRENRISYCFQLLSFFQTMYQLCSGAPDKPLYENRPYGSHHLLQCPAPKFILFCQLTKP